MAMTPEQLQAVEKKLLQTAPAPGPSSSSTLSPRAQAAEQKLLEQTGQVHMKESPSFLDQALGAFDTGIEKVSNLPVLKQIKQGVGGVFGLGGALVGGPARGAAKLVHNIATKKPITEGVIQEAKKGAESTGTFGSQVGESAAVGAPFGFLGKVPNAILAGAQLYRGGKEIYQGYKEGDAEKGMTGALDVGMGLLGTHGAIKSKGAIINRNVFPKNGPTPEANLKKATNLMEEGTQYKARPAIQKKMSDKAVEAKTYGKPAPKNPNQTLVEEGVTPETVKLSHGPRVFDTEAQQIELTNRIRAVEEMGSVGLGHSDPIPKHDLAALRDEIVSKIDDNSAETGAKMKRAISDYFNAEIDKHGSSVTSGNLNRIKQGLYDTGYTVKGDPARTQIAPAYRKAANHLKTSIESGNKEFPVKETNQLLSDLINARKYLKDIHGTQVKGSYLGKKFAGIVGAGAGRSTGIPILGDLIGYHIGTELHDLVSDPTRKLILAGKIKTGTPPSTAIKSKLYESLRKIYAKRLKTPALGRGKPTPPVEEAIPLGGIAENGMRIDEKGNPILDDNGNPIFEKPKTGMTTAQETISRHKAIAKTTGKSSAPRSGDFNTDDVRLEQGKNPNQFFLHRKGYAPTSITKQEAIELARSGMEVHGHNEGDKVLDLEKFVYGKKGVLNPKRNDAVNRKFLEDFVYGKKRDIQEANFTEKQIGKNSGTTQNFIGKRAKNFEQIKAELFPDANEKNRIEANIKLHPEFEAALKKSPKGMLGNPSFSLRGAIDYPKLFEAYPAAKNIKIKLTPNRGEIGGSMTNLDGGGVIIHISKGQTAANTLDTIRHEIQHYIQAKEGWSRGGGEHSIFQPDVQYYTLLNMKRNVLNNRQARGAASVGDMEYMDKMIKKTRGGKSLTPPEIHDVFGSGDKFDKASFATYEKLWGEAEARGDFNPNTKYIFSKRSNVALSATTDSKKKSLLGTDKMAKNHK